MAKKSWKNIEKLKKSKIKKKNEQIESFKSVIQLHKNVINLGHFSSTSTREEMKNVKNKHIKKK